MILTKTETGLSRLLIMSELMRSTMVFVVGVNILPAQLKRESKLVKADVFGDECGKL